MKTSFRTASRRSFRVNGFTLIELLVTFAIIGLLAALLLPALSQAKSHSLSTICLSNLKQQQLAWHLYADDNRDRVVPNNSFSSVSEPGSNDDPFEAESGATWCPGIAPLDTTSSNLEQGLVYPYLKAATIYRCPMDHSTVTGTSALPRTRSYCMNISLSCDDALGSFRKTGDIFNPSPSHLFVLIDTQEQDIWDSTFGIFSSDSIYAGYWLDLPADRHSQGANLSFADGHAEHWSWKAAKKFTTRWESPYNSSDLADLRRLQSFAKTGID